MILSTLVIIPLCASAIHRATLVRMKLIVAQGNPGAQYTTTRHNAGWIALDAVAHNHGASFASKPKFFADIAEVTANDEKMLLVKPTTFYNETGRAVRALLDFYKLSSKDVLVLHDDVALPFGVVRIRQEGSDGGNKGIQSISAHIGERYTRLRIGVANANTANIPTADFVLSKFLATEQQALQEHILPTILTCVHTFIRDGQLKPTSHNHHPETAY